MATNTQRGTPAQSKRGDFTGRAAEALAEEAETKVNARREEMGMITHNQRRVKQEGVIDMTGDSPTLEGTDELVDNDVKTPTLTKAKAKPVTEGVNVNVGSGATVEVLEIAPEIDPDSPAQVLRPGSEMEPVTIQVLFELEEITLGYGNTMNFHAGYKYKLPRWMAQHLVSRQIANQLTVS